MGINQFADMINKENAGKSTRIRNPQLHTLRKALNTNLTDIPDYIDWRDYGCVEHVKEPGQCGSDWAFCAVASLESQTCIANGKLVSLSEQNLLDCTWDYGNKGCSGGYIDKAYDYIIDNQGIDTEASYPYEERDGICRYNAINKGAIAYDYVYYEVSSDDELRYIVATVGPACGYVDSSTIGFQLYESGVYDDPLCFLEIKDDCVLIVGYGSDYFIIRNNWGTMWGEQGYMKIASECIRFNEVIYPIVTPPSNASNV